MPETEEMGIENSKDDCQALMTRQPMILVVTGACTGLVLLAQLEKLKNIYK